MQACCAGFKALDSPSRDKSKDLTIFRPSFLSRLDFFKNTIFRPPSALDRSEKAFSCFRRKKKPMNQKLSKNVGWRKAGPGLGAVQ
jgi:hypothetical protein